MFWKKKQTGVKATEAKPQKVKKLSPKDIIASKVEQLGPVFAPGDRYQGDNLLPEWLRRAGVPSIKRLWQQAKKEHRLWIYPTGKLAP